MGHEILTFRGRLRETYEYSKAKIIVREMADNIVMHLVAKNPVTELIILDIGYDREMIWIHSMNFHSRILTFVIFDI